MKKTLTALWLCAAMALTTAMAQTAAQPTFHKLSYSDNAIATKLSDNGKWAVAQAVYTEQRNSGKAKLVNTETEEYTELQTAAEVTRDGACQVTDVTDDGAIVVGAYKNQPAYWDKETGTWATLSVPSGRSGGLVYSVTPDGKYAVGSCYDANDVYYECAMMWDLATGDTVALANLPTLDMTHQDMNQQRFTDISADGRYLVGYMSYSYIQPTGICVYVYDRQTATYKFVGFTPSDTDAWTPAVEGIYFVQDPVMSPNGKYVGVTAYMVKETAGSETLSEYEVAALYEVETGTFHLYDSSEDQGYTAMAIDDLGTVYGATPSANPVREWSVRYQGFWYPISLILEQKYGVDFYNKTKYDNTGSPFSVSSDGKTVCSMVDASGNSYVLNMPEAPVALCADINLLENYEVTPTDGAAFTKLSAVTVRFDRPIKVVGGSSSATLKDANGNTVRQSSGFAMSSTDNRTLSIRFRTTTLTEGATYTVEIPQGTVCVDGDDTKTNAVITVSYTGRANTAVRATAISPADGSEIAKIDNGSNPIIITFDAQVAKTDTASGALIRMEDGAQVAKLNVLASGNKVAVYPTSTQYLYEGLDYKVVLGAGAVTDLTGSGANEEISLNYKGTYVRELSTDDAVLFSDDFANMSQSLRTWLRYEGDHNTPVSDLDEYGFDKDNQPWNFSLHDDDNTSDYCAASHSMYSPAGKSDDWMVIPQLDIPDNSCKLTFLAQSYKKAKTDSLKVVVWENEENLNYLSDSIMARMKAEGKLVFSQLLTPGTNEGALAGDWTSYTVDLAPFAGKKIYIGFLNDNTDQSMVFVDSVVVKRDLPYLLSLTNDEAVVGKDSINISGRLTANNEAKTYQSVWLTLCGTDGQAIETVGADGLALASGSQYDFKFTKPLPLQLGETNNFTIKVQLDDYSDVAKASVKNLTFNPVKRVVLEEMTGTTCVNCPLGILAIERLRATYGDLFIPISIHTYTGDQLGSGLSGYTSALGLSAAPSGIINRSGVISFPMQKDPATLDYIFSNGYDLWADYVGAEMNIPADVELNSTIKVDTTAATFDLPLTMRSAINAKNQNLNVFIAVVEDGIISYQQNNFSGVADDNLGDWGLGGKHGQAIATYVTHDDVVRQTYSNSSDYNGVGGFFPQTLVAGQEYTATISGLALPENISTLANCKAIVMLLDGNTDKVVNAVSVKFSSDPAAIDQAVTDKAQCRLTQANGYIEAKANGTVTLSLYSAAGTLLGTATGNGTVALPTAGHKGAAIVKATSGGSTVTRKVVLQ